MGMRFRKSKKIGPFRFTLSKSGIGMSVGVKGFRVTKTSSGRVRTTASIPGTGISYVKDSSPRSASRAKSSSNRTKDPHVKIPNSGDLPRVHKKTSFYICLVLGALCALSAIQDLLFGRLEAYETWWHGLPVAAVFFFTAYWLHRRNKTEAVAYAEALTELERRQAEEAEDAAVERSRQNDLSHDLYERPCSTALTPRKAASLQSFVVLDTETTGLSPQENRIIEFAAHRVVRGEIVESMSILINPGMPIPGRITKITGIRTGDVENEPLFDEVAPDVYAFIGHDAVVGHNVRFDISFLAAEFQRVGVDFSCEYVDTVSLARKAFPGLENYKLNTLIQEFDLMDHEQDHRALSDVDATLKLFYMCQEKLNLRKTQRTAPD